MPDASLHAPPASARYTALAMRVLGTYGTIIVLLAMLIVFSALKPGTFATVTNFRNIINDMSIATIVAAGLTIPLVAGDFDLSIGYVASFAGILVVGLLSNSGLAIPLAILIAVGFGTLVGIVNGIIVSKIGVNAFIATLGTGTVVVGLNYAYAGGIPLQLTQSREFTGIALGRIAGVPHLIIIMIVILAVLWVILNRTVQGQHIKAIGVSGVGTARRHPIDRPRTSPSPSPRPARRSAGTDGFQSRFGPGDRRRRLHADLVFRRFRFGSVAGRQFHPGTLIGVLTVAVGNNGLAMIGAPIFTQFLFTGSLLVIAVALGVRPPLCEG